MTTTLLLADPRGPADLDTFLGRAIQVEDGSARLVAHAGVLAVYVPVLFPSGLLDDSATVLGLRTFALADAEAEADSVVPMASLRARAAAAAAGDGFELGMPTPVYSVTWAGVVPPRGGWQPRQDAVPSGLLAEVAEHGIREVAAALPAGVGEAIVRQVRAAVWGEPIPEAPALPRGAALAAAALGFLPPEGAEPDVGAVYEVGPWTRLTLARGHVLVKRRSWSLAG
ncbi:MAG: hypothetical protein BGO95_03770 [Micrococcales bacterium 73-13]|nr:MAG: hypothetical protein BGO95_03770 [Micrococcales bacterium 73-13]